MSTQNADNQQTKTKIDSTSKVRLWECKTPIDSKPYYVLEKKNWFGLWMKPPGLEHKLFFDKQEALNWFEWYKSGKKVEKKLIAVS